MTQPQNSVFISYRRRLSRHLARLIFMDLREHGYDVFLDVRNIDAGQFDRIILNQIGARAHFVLVLAEGSLAGCQDEADWLRREIETAFALGRNIVPVLDEGVDLATEAAHLPQPLGDELARRNALPLVHFYFEAGMEALRERFLKTAPRIGIRPAPGDEQTEIERFIQAAELDEEEPPPRPPRPERERPPIDISPEQQRLINRLHDASLSIEERLAAGDELAEEGDPRPGIGLLPDGLPDVDWVALPAGRFRFGSDKSHDPYARGNERPQHILHLPAFDVARYPVTHAQFQAFIDAPDGHRNEEWWNGLKKVEAVEGRWPIPNRPRETVTWFEAMAFCRWLSAKLGYEIRLPTEAEWERAARGPDGLIYPYGDEFEAGKCNSQASALQQTSTAGLFPPGASPEGLLDMSGNVWEWTLSAWRNPYQPINAETETVDWRAEQRVMRGGSWLNTDVFLRGAYRSPGAPARREGYIGFRVCAPC